MPRRSKQERRARLQQLIQSDPRYKGSNKHEIGIFLVFRDKLIADIKSNSKIKNTKEVRERLVKDLKRKQLRDWPTKYHNYSKNGKLDDKNVRWELVENAVREFAELPKSEHQKMDVSDVLLYFDHQMNKLPKKQRGNSAWAYLKRSIIENGRLSYLVEEILHPTPKKAQKKD